MSARPSRRSRLHASLLAAPLACAASAPPAPAERVAPPALAPAALAEPATPTPPALPALPPPPPLPGTDLPLPAGFELACAARTRLRCQERGDLDADGEPDHVRLVRPRGGAALGLLVQWGRGGHDVLGAGVRGQTWRERVDDSTRTATIDPDLRWLADWDLVPARGPAGARTGFQAKRGLVRTYAAPGVIGDGIYLSGGDAAGVAYWTPETWRFEHLGF